MEQKDYENSFIPSILGFSSHIRNYTNGKYKSDRMISITTIDRTHLKCDSVDGPRLNSTRRPTFFVFASGPGQRTTERLQTQ